MRDGRQPIRQLPDSLINQIAAGEVVERPASIVKELVENSIDAGAGRIDIEIDGGGIERVSVRDDGAGIPKSELELAFLRNCTSKLTDSRALRAIVSLGFRGEALASIAAVAQVELISRTDDDNHGWRLVGGRLAGIDSPRAHAHPPGTTIVVRDLFKDLPARRHFLKRPQTEFLHIQQFVKRIAFCHPDIAFALHSDARQLLKLPPISAPGGAIRRWRGVFGKQFVDRARPIQLANDTLRIEGWVGGAELTRQSSDLQFLAVNGRIVRDRHLSHAIRMAFDDTIEPGRYPVYALHLTLPADAVDVNVHPSKSEVRFRNLRDVHDFVFVAAKRCLAGEESALQPSAEEPPPIWRAGKLAEPSPAPGYSAAAARTGTAPSASCAWGALIAIVYGRYALCDDGGRLVAIDLRRCVTAMMEQKLTAVIKARPLLLPLRIDLHTEHFNDATCAALAALGCEVAQLGPTSFTIRTVPVGTPEIEGERFASALAQGLAAGSEPRRAIVSAAAEAYAIAAGLHAQRQQLDGLWRQLTEHGFDLQQFSGIVSPESLARCLSGSGQ